MLAGILPDMTAMTGAHLQELAALSGFTFDVPDLETIRPAVERLVEALVALERLGVEQNEPARQYRIL